MTRIRRTDVKRGRSTVRRSVLLLVPHARDAAGAVTLLICMLTAAPAPSAPARHNRAAMQLATTGSPPSWSAPGPAPAGALRRRQPFNRPISAAPPVHANSAAIVARVLAFGAASNLVAGTADTTSDWQHPTYYPQASDPLFTLHCTQPWGTCPIEGMQIRVPDAARPAGGSDAHMTIVDQATGWEYDLWSVTSKPPAEAR